MSPAVPFAKLIALSYLFSYLFSYQSYAATPLSNLENLTMALERGDNINVAIDLAQCEPSTHKGRGGFKIKAYRISKDNTLVFSDHHFTLLPNGQAIIEFMRYRVSADQTIHFTVDQLSLPSYTSIEKQKTYHCKMNQGFNFYSAAQSPN